MAYVPPRVMTIEAPPVIVIGAGGHGKVLIDTLRMMGRQILCVTDDACEHHGKMINDIEVRGATELINAVSPDTVELINGIGSVCRPEVRKKIFNRFKYRGYRFATVIHPAAVVAHSAEIAQGVQVMAGAVIQSGALIGANAILNTRCSVDHDCVIGAHTHLAPGVTLSGDVTIGQICHLGTGASVIQNVNVGAEAVVAAGAVVIRDILARGAACGVPAKPMN